MKEERDRQKREEKKIGPNFFDLDTRQPPTGTPLSFLSRTPLSFFAEAAISCALFPLELNLCRSLRFFLMLFNKRLK